MDSLSHISLSISHGEQIGFIGASGSGKTTLAGILCGLMNMQLAVKDGEIYIIEVNPRASRTVPFLSLIHI